MLHVLFMTRKKSVVATAADVASFSVEDNSEGMLNTKHWKTELMLLLMIVRTEGCGLRNWIENVM